MLGAMLLTEVNLFYYQDLMAGMRAAIADESLLANSLCLAKYRM